MRSVGLEIGDGYLRAVEADGGPGGASIRKFVQAPVSPREGQSAEDALVEAIDGLFRQHSLPRGNVCISIDSTEAVIREISMPVTADDQLRKTVKFQFEHHVHNKSVDDLIVDFYKIDKRDKTTLILAAGVPKAVIEHRLELCQRARIDPTVIDLDLFALFNGANGAGAFEGRPAALLVQLHARFAKLLAVDDGRLRFVRNIRLSMGGTRPIGAPADAVAQSVSGTYQVATPSGLAEVLNREIARSLLSYPLKQSIAGIVVTGVAEQVQPVLAPLQEQSSIPTVGFTADQDQPETSAATVALGLAFRGLGIDHVGTDFRREEFKFERRFETVKRSAALCLCMMAVLLGLIALYYRNRFRDYAGFRDQIVAKQVEIVQKIHQELEPGKEPAACDDPIADAKRTLKLQEELVGKGDHPLPMSALQHWKQINEQLVGFDYLRLNTMSINLERNQILMKGEISKIEVAERLTNQIKTVPGYNVQPGPYTQSGEQRLSFDWNISIAKPER